MTPDDEAVEEIHAIGSADTGREIAWYDLGYRWWCLRVWWHSLPARVSWWVAFRLPRRVALFAFVRVYANWGECGEDYGPVYKAWEAVGKQRIETFGAGDAAARRPHQPEIAEQKDDTKNFARVVREC